MKKLLFFALILHLFSACNNNSSVDPSLDGTWKVSYYLDSGKDETSNFSGYTFDFQSNGTLIAKFSGQTVTGTWSENTSSNKLIINISGTDKLDDAADDWLIISKTATSIKLRDDNTSKDEQLHFTKL
ncbi:MAG: hypothetical protein JNL70_01465 [Saprospiraceae bacterium]|nr:hypothetical protein [Saprospiraceae bacterium]